MGGGAPAPAPRRGRGEGRGRGRPPRSESYPPTGVVHREKTPQGVHESNTIAGRVSTTPGGTERVLPVRPDEWAALDEAERAKLKRVHWKASPLDGKSAEEQRLTKQRNAVRASGAKKRLYQTEAEAQAARDKHADRQKTARADLAENDPEAAQAARDKDSDRKKTARADLAENDTEAALDELDMDMD